MKVPKEENFEHSSSEFCIENVAPDTEVRGVREVRGIENIAPDTLFRLG